MILIARARAQGASVLIMDELTADLDYSNQARILHVTRTLAWQGYSILLSSHVPDHAFLVCNQAALWRIRQTVARTGSSPGNHHRQGP
jgi:iron complex transport system ATP-binding protein